MKRLFCFFLALLLMLPMLPAPAKAAATSGSCGENVTWSYNTSTKTLTISGSGKMADYDNYEYSPDPAPWNHYKGQITKVIIQQGVTSISSCAFYECTKLTEVSIPNSVTSIGFQAFYYCINLERIQLPGSLTEIKWSAFNNCKKLKSITIPAGVTKIPSSAFYNCVLLSDVTLPQNLTEIDDSAFGQCKALTEIKLPDSLTRIGGAAFNVAGLKTVKLPNGLKELGEMAFCGSKLTSVAIPSGITEIPYAAFANCYSLASVTLPNNLTKIGRLAFYECWKLKSITIPDSVDIIEYSAFNQCKALTRVTIPEGITHIEDGTFNACANLKRVDLPESIIYIGENVFWGCNSLSHVYYGGTKADKQEITIGTGNVKLKKANWHYKAMPVPAVSGRLSSWFPVLTWNAIPNATGYQVYRAAKKDGTYKLQETTTSTSFLDGNINNWGVKYFYKVRALQGSAKSGFSSIVALRSKLDPAYITVKTAAVSGCPKITWYKVPNATKYTIFRSSSAGGAYTEIGTTTKLNYVDKTAAVGSTYYYKVQACCADSYANADLSNYGSATCVLARPVVKIALKKGDPKLTWKEISGAHHYEIYRALKKNGNYQQIDTTYDLSYVDSSAKAGKTYFYKVVAVHSNPSFNSAMSAAKSITAK